mgnify:CR=1 FL=1
MDFPVKHPIKIIGNNIPTFIEIINKATVDRFPDFVLDTNTVRLSKNGRYISVTVTILFKNQEELDDLYRAYTSIPDVQFVL